MIWNDNPSNTTELDKRYVYRRTLIRRPRENLRKILKKISSVFIGENVIFA